MSQENVEVVGRAVEFEFVGRGDRDEAEAIFDVHSLTGRGIDGTVCVTTK